MEHESFENVNTACLMNENFVNIKIDLEERRGATKHLIKPGAKTNRFLSVSDIRRVIGVT